MKCIVNTFLFLLFCTITYGQESNNKIELGIPKTTVFLPSDYNGEAQNFDFIQDDKGILYVANTVGFLEFNGISWRGFKPDNDGVPVSFSKDSKGTIFAGGTGFIGYLDVNEKGEKYFVSLKDKLPQDFSIGIVWDIFNINDVLYFKNDKNIISYDNSSIEIIKSPYPVDRLLKFKNKIYIDTNKGLYLLVNKKFIFVEGSEKLGKPFVRFLLENDKKEIVAVTLKSGLFTVKKGATKELKVKISDFCKKEMPASYSILNDNIIAISTIKGGLLFVNKKLEPVYRLSTRGGLTNNNVKKVVQDNQNNLWIGSNRGITKIKYPITTTFYNHNKQEIGTIEEITSYKNDLYLGASLGTYKLESITQNQLLTDNHYPEFKHLSIDDINNYSVIEFGGKLLYGGQDKIHFTDDKTLKIIQKLYSRKFYKSIFNPKILFVGHLFGCEILFFDDNYNIINTKKINEIDTEIRGVVEDDDKNLWLTSVSDGVYKISFDEGFENQKITHFGLEDGLPSLRDNLVYNINNNDVVFTTHKGLFKFDEASQKFVPETRFGEKFAGGKEEYIYAFNFDKNENAWMHSFRNKTATTAIKNELGNYILYEKPLKDIGEMQAYEILSEPDKNVVWYGGSDGLARFDISKSITKKDTIFYAVISKVIGTDERVLVGGHQFDKSINTTLLATERDIRFEVGATDFTNLKETKYQYFLEGYDTKWSDFTKEPFKIYTNLNHGNYIFKVRAKNYLENISIPDNYTFSILPFWYQETWFKLLLFLLTIAFISYITNYFSKRKFVKKVHELELIQKYEQEKNQAIIKQKKQGLKALIEAQESERGKIARELHDGVVQQIGSVILKSRSLFAKKNLLEEKESQELLDNLENSNKDLRNISHQMMPRALKELGIIAALDDLLDGSLTYSKIKYSLEHFNIDKRLPKRIEITIYRITQELINNIIKHSKAKEVSVQLFKSNNAVVLIVEDNGVGFSSKKSEKGIGLLNISSRLDMVNGDVNFEPSPKSGTLVTIKIPL
ncbi:MAG: ATP-binding protein [Polaribacter sp.]|uniref:sensor histidine kinase n=1 Tax=Polaribacter sp. TaxID=1920175 RepID=UPI002F357064